MESAPCTAGEVASWSEGLSSSRAGGHAEHTELASPPPPQGQQEFVEGERPSLLLAGERLSLSPQPRRIDYGLAHVRGTDCATPLELRTLESELRGVLAEWTQHLGSI